MNFERCRLLMQLLRICLLFYRSHFLLERFGLLYRALVLFSGKGWQINITHRKSIRESHQTQGLTIQGCAKKLVPGWEKSSAQLHPGQAGHARLVLNKPVSFYAQCCTIKMAVYTDVLFKIYFRWDFGWDF